MNDFACVRTRTLFDAWLDDALPEDDALLVTNHLAGCASCAAAFADDVRLGESVGAAVRTVKAPRWDVLRKHGGRAAAAVLIAASFLTGRATAPEGVGEPDSGYEPGSQEEHDRLHVDEPERFGVFMPVAYAEAALTDAEREGIALRYSAAEARRIRAELELAARRREAAGPVDAAAVVTELRRRVRDHVESGDGCEVYRRVRAAARVLSGEPAAGLAAARAWLGECATDGERRAAVRLVSAIDPAAAFDTLAAEAQGGPARDVAVDGLARTGDERARPLFAAIADDAAVDAHLRARALGGLHRLGDAHAAERLAALFRESEDRGLRRRIVYLMAARPTSFVSAELPQLASLAGFEPRDRRFLADFVAVPGDEASRSLSERLRF